MNKKYRIEVNKNISMSLCRQLSQMQKVVWEMSDGDTLPPWKLFITPEIGGFIIVAYDNNKPIAHAIFTHAVSRDSIKAYLYLDMIGVLPEYQGQKIGEIILRRAQELARKYKHFAIQL
jgi:predicted GNAT superfamily acetyltransferase